MLNKTYLHPRSMTIGRADRLSGHPDGSTLLRIKDRWFMADETVPLSWVIGGVMIVAAIALAFWDL